MGFQDGINFTEIKSIQKENKSISEALSGDKVAVALLNVIIGRQIEEGDVLYSFLTENEFREYKKFKDYLTSEEKVLLKEISEIMRKENPVWGV